MMSLKLQRQPHPDHSLAWRIGYTARFTVSQPNTGRLLRVFFPLCFPGLVVPIRVQQRIKRRKATPLTKGRNTIKLLDMSTRPVEHTTDDPVEPLRKVYASRFAGMQTEEAHEAYEDAFTASPDDLGKTAVSAARRAQQQQ